MLATVAVPQAPGVAAIITDYFFARCDTFAYQWWSNTRQVGGYGRACHHRRPWVRASCKHRVNGKTCGTCESFTALPVSGQAIELHLRGAFTMGTYQLAADGVSCLWGCIDQDHRGDTEPSELRSAALRMVNTMERWGLAPCAEASGGNGFRLHIWTFFATPIPASKVRVVLNAVLRECGLCDVPHIEVFPKQARALGGYGNLVRLPFGIHQKTRRRSRFLDDDWYPIEDTSAALATIRPVDPLVLDYIIDVKQLELSEQASSRARPARNFDHPPEGMARILERCCYFQELERRQRTKECRVGYEDWYNAILMFSRFGDAGVGYLVDLSACDPRFDYDYTIKQVNYIRQRGYHAPSCRRLREGPGCIRCTKNPVGCGVE